MYIHYIVYVSRLHSGWLVSEMIRRNELAIGEQKRGGWKLILKKHLFQILKNAKI